MEVAALTNGGPWDIPDAEYLVATVPEKEYPRRMPTLLRKNSDRIPCRHELPQSATTVARVSTTLN
jgi:hypothetical protein